MIAAPDATVVVCAYTERSWGDLVAGVAAARAQGPAEVLVVIDHNDGLLAAAADLADERVRVVANARRAVSVDGSSTREIEEIPAKVGEPLTLTGSVEDEGLPRGSSVVSTWRQTSGPGKATFEDAAQVRTKVTFDSAGTYELELHATDGTLEGAEKIRVKVAGG